MLRQRHHKHLCAVTQSGSNKKRIVSKHKSFAPPTTAATTTITTPTQQQRFSTFQRKLQKRTTLSHSPVSSSVTESYQQYQQPQHQHKQQCLGDSLFNGAVYHPQQQQRRVMTTVHETQKDLDCFNTQRLKLFNDGTLSRQLDESAFAIGLDDPAETIAPLLGTLKALNKPFRATHKHLLSYSTKVAPLFSQSQYHSYEGQRKLFSAILAVHPAEHHVFEEVDHGMGLEHGSSSVVPPRISFGRPEIMGVNLARIHHLFREYDGELHPFYKTIEEDVREELVVKNIVFQNDQEKEQHIKQTTLAGLQRFTNVCRDASLIYAREELRKEKMDPWLYPGFGSQHVMIAPSGLGKTYSTLFLLALVHQAGLPIIFTRSTDHVTSVCHVDSLSSRVSDASGSSGSSPNNNDNNNNNNNNTTNVTIYSWRYERQQYDDDKLPSTYFQDIRSIVQPLAKATDHKIIFFHDSKEFPITRKAGSSFLKTLIQSYRGMSQSVPNMFTLAQHNLVPVDHEGIMRRGIKEGPRVPTSPFTGFVPINPHLQHAYTAALYRTAFQTQTHHIFGKFCKDNGKEFSLEEQNLLLDRILSDAATICAPFPRHYNDLLDIIFTASPDWKKNRGVDVDALFSEQQQQQQLYGFPALDRFLNRKDLHIDMFSTNNNDNGKEDPTTRLVRQSIYHSISSLSGNPASEITYPTILSRRDPSDVRTQTR